MHFVLITNPRKLEDIYCMSSFSHHVHRKIMVTTNTTARQKLSVYSCLSLKPIWPAWDFSLHLES